MPSVRREYKAQPVKVADIILDPECQPRVSIDTAIVEEYAERLQAGAIFDNIEVYQDGKKFWCADGFHRVMAYKAAERGNIPANVHQGGKREAILHAVGANTTHGLRRSNADKRRAVEMLLRDAEWSKWSDRQIADQCGVSGPFVGDVRRAMTPIQVQTVSTCDEPKTRTGRDGKQYPAKVKNKGKDAFDAAGEAIDDRITPEVTIPDEVTSVQAIIEEHQEQEAKEEDLSHDEWVQTLPLAQTLKSNALKSFRASAILYRELAPLRDNFAYHAKRAINAAGRKADAYGFLVKRFIGVDHPKTWVRCADVSEGGCGGSGQIDLIGECGQCHGHGFKVRGGFR